MMDLIIAEEHSQLYDLWLERGDMSLAVCHVDFHCDMRGLLIDRRLGKARLVWQCDPSMNRLDSGSFLAHAVMQGMVTRLRWVHDAFGGRGYDDLYCVKYETDLSALPFRLRKGARWVPLLFEEQTFADWGGPGPGEHLCIDWDGIAFAEYDKGHIRRLMAEILERDFEPQSIFVARSPGYCHPDESLFNEFITALEKKFDARAVHMPFKRQQPVRLPLPWKLYHGLEHGILRQMRRLGMY